MYIYIYIYILSNKEVPCEVNTPALSPNIMSRLNMGSICNHVQLEAAWTTMMRTMTMWRSIQTNDMIGN